MTVKGREKAISDPRNRAIATITDKVEINYLGQMELLAKRARRWNVSTTVQMGSRGVFEHSDGPMMITSKMNDHFSTDKMSIHEAVDAVVENLRSDMGKSCESKHSIYLVLTINRNSRQCLAALSTIYYD